MSPSCQATSAQALAWLLHAGTRRQARHWHGCARCQAPSTVIVHSERGAGGAACAPEEADRAEAVEAQLHAEVGIEDDPPVQRHHGERPGREARHARRRRAERSGQHQPEAELDVEGDLAVLVRHERRYGRADHQRHDADVVQLLLRAWHAFSATPVAFIHARW